MKNISTLILKNGIQTLIEDDDASFKKSLSDCLSLKLNTAIQEVETDFKFKIFEDIEETGNNENLKYFLNFVENYDSKVNNKLKLKNQSYINITESELECLVNLFDNLSIKNRQLMLEEILESPNKLRSNIEFYQKTKAKYAR